MNNSSVKTAELESIAEWQVSATEKEEDGMGDLFDLPICRGRIATKETARTKPPWDQLDEEIKEIQKDDVESAQK
jgi:hypothetical protein